MNLLKKYSTKYVGPRAVFVLNLLISLCSSFIILLLVNYLTGIIRTLHGIDAVWLTSSAVGIVLAMCLLKSHRTVIRHSTLRDFLIVFVEISIKGIVMLVALAVSGMLQRVLAAAVVFDVIMTFGIALVIRVALMLIYDSYTAHIRDAVERKRILVYGTSDKAAAAITRLQNSSHYRIVGLLDKYCGSEEMKLVNQRVYNYSDLDELKSLVTSLSVSGIMFTSEDDARRQQDVLVDFCIRNGLNCLILPTVEEVAGGKIMKRTIRNIKIEDLLGRDEIRISMDEIRSSLKGKVVMVTGAAGSIGSELCRQLAQFEVSKVVLYDNAETPMHYVRLELEERFPTMQFVPIIGDVRSVMRLDFAFREHHPDVVFHAAAYKHVPLMEENPCEAVMVNVFGSHNVADKCVEYGVEKMVMISTDKAVNPTNIMGCSKRLAEIYVQSLAAAIEQGKVQGSTKFITTRFGNVLGSNGSVIPRFREQIEKGGPVTVTHPKINRFFMTIPEACRLVMEAAAMGIPNRIFVFDMGKPVMIVDLAKRMIELSGLKVGVDIDIEFIGLRPGEKLYEEVLATTENTDPTSHDRIRIAHTREYDYEDAAKAVDELTSLADNVRIPDMVKLMKRVVAEYKSQNSKFAEYDK